MTDEIFPGGPASGLIEIAGRRLAKDYPFHAGVVASWRIEESRSVRTVGITVRRAALILVYNSAFVQQCSFGELAGVLLHEVNHVVFGHLLDHPEDYPDGLALLLTHETIANEWLAGLPLPGEPILLAHFPGLPPDEDTPTRYARLAGRWPPRCNQTAAAGQNKVAGEPTHAREGEAEAGWEPKTGPGEPKKPAAGPLDDHGLWAEARAGGALAELTVRAAVQQASQRLKKEAYQRLPEAVRAQIDRAARGTEPGDQVAGVARGGTAAGIDWRALLRRYVRHATTPQPIYTRPPRRFRQLVGILPGRILRPDKARVMAVIDTSGSISPPMLSAISAELELMRRVHEVIVVECDARVQAIYPLQDALGHVRGRGGTDLRPPLEREVLTRVRPSVIVYFTDGKCPAGAAPGVPLLWCLTPNGSRPAAWGRVVRLNVAPAGPPG